MSSVVNVNKIVHADFVSSSQQVSASGRQSKQQQTTISNDSNHLDVFPKKMGETVATTTSRGGHAATKLARQEESCSSAHESVIDDVGAVMSLRAQQYSTLFISLRGVNYNNVDTGHVSVSHLGNGTALTKLD